MDPASPVSIVLGVLLGGLLLLWFQVYVRPARTRSSKTGARVPVGASGWPLLGETMAFAHNPSEYSSSRLQKYGPIWRSNLFFKPAIVGTSVEFAKLVVSNSSLFASGWPESVKGVIGQKAFVFKDGVAHMSVKKLLQKAVLPETLKTRVSDLESIIFKNINSWAEKGSIVAREGNDKITCEFGMFMLLGVRDIVSTPEGKAGLQNFAHVSKGLHALPINLPGTDYNKGLKAKAALRNYFKSLLEKKKGGENHQSDILGVLLAAKEDPASREEVKELDDDTIADNLVLMWFGSFDTTSTTLTWLLKLLHEYPECYKKVQAEQLEILKNRDPSQKGLTWEETKKMVYTTKFFMEMQRFVSISACVVRTATQDVEFEGHLIPKDWAVTVMFNSIHTNPDIYPDPFKFDPSRQDTPSKPNTYLPFSTGPHICPGIEVAKLVGLIYLHHLTTSFVHESAGPDLGLVYNSFPSPKGGYPINIRRREP